MRTNSSTTAPNKRTKGESGLSSVPLFLKKTFRMIETSDPAIATWADGGTTFVVKDVEKFQAEVIPEFFKHNNFSSFVRQLNFYCFRKVKCDILRVRDAESSNESKYWKFRHEMFQQGREDLLHKIRKATNNDNNSEKQKMEDLKQEVDGLRNELGSVRAEMLKMTEMMKLCVKQQENQSHFERKEMQVTSGQMPKLGSKRKLEDVPSPIASGETVQTMFSNSAVDPIPSHRVPVSVQSRNKNEKDDSMTDNATKCDQYSITPFPQFSQQDEAILSSLFSQEIDEAVESHQAPPAVSPDEGKSEAMENVCEVLSSLPKNVQDEFASRLVAVMSDPDVLYKQADALSHLASKSSKIETDISSEWTMNRQQGKESHASPDLFEV